MRNKHSTRRNPQQEESPSILIPGPDVLRELIPILFEEDTNAQPLWTIRQRRQQRYKRGNYVDFTLEVEPYNGSESIAFLFAAPEDEGYLRYLAFYNEAYAEGEVRQLAEAVLQGVKGALREKAAGGTRMANLLVGLTRLGVHPVDARPSLYRWSANAVMQTFLEPNNLVSFTS